MSKKPNMNTRIMIGERNISPKIERMMSSSLNDVTVITKVK